MLWLFLAPLAQAEMDFALSAQEFHTLAQSFYDGVFQGDLKSVQLSDTQTFLFSPARVNRLLTNFSVHIQAPFDIPQDMETMVQTVQSAIETAQLIQETFPDVFLFDQERAAGYAEEGLGFLLGEADLWLWAEDGRAVFLPMAFYNETTGALADGFYLIFLSKPSDAEAYFVMYHSPDYVVEYMRHMRLNTENSDFQKAMILWYMAKFEAPQEAETPNAGDEASRRWLGTVTVSAKNSANVREDSSADSELVYIARHGQSYRVLSIAENGWFEIQLPDGKTGFISPQLVEHQY
jgi:hypothetical protein